jgi:hypothetical protein
MKKVLLALVIFTATVIRVGAQDTIIKTDGSEIRAKVIEIALDVIKYKIFDNQDGPVYVLSKSDIFMIKYESKRRELFSTATTSSTGTATTSSSGNTVLQTSGTKSATSGTVTTSNTGQPPETVVKSSKRQQTSVTQYPYDWKSRMQATAPDLYKKYREGATLSGVGIGMLSAGVVMIIVGAATGEKSTTTTATSVSVNVGGTGGAVLAIGSVCVLAGTPLMIVGLSKKSKAKRKYFNQYGNRVEYKSPLQLPHFELRTNGIAFVF